MNKKSLISMFLMIGLNLLCSGVFAVGYNSQEGESSSANCSIDDIGNLTQEILSLSELIQRKDREIEVIESRIDTQLNDDKGEIDWDGINNLETELFLLKVNRSHIKAKITRFQTFQDFLNSNFSLPEEENTSRMEFFKHGSEFIGEKIMVLQKNTVDLYRGAKDGEVTLDEIRYHRDNIDKLLQEQFTFGLEYSRLSYLRRLNESVPLFKERYSTLYGDPVYPCDALPGYDCPAIAPDLPTEGWNYLYDLTQTKVWIAAYDTPEPSMEGYIEGSDVCDLSYTTDMSYYWDILTADHPSTQSIQIKWFYSGYVTGSDRVHDIIWEGNKNANTEWYTYGAPLTSVTPDDGVYWISNSWPGHHDCCVTPQGECDWCNTHCGECFACDRDQYQHFVFDGPIENDWPTLNQNQNRTGHSNLVGDFDYTETPTTSSLKNDKLAYTAIGDINSDGKQEIVVVNEDKIYAMDGALNILWTYTNSQIKEALNTPTIWDLDGDGEQEIAVATFDYKLVVLNGKTGALEKSYNTDNKYVFPPVIITRGSDTYMVFGDGNDNFVNGRVYVKNLKTPSQDRKITSIGGRTFFMSAGDVDNDGEDEVIGTYWNGIFVLDPDDNWNVEWKNTQYSFSAPAPSFGDTMSSVSGSEIVAGTWGFWFGGTSGIWHINPANGNNLKKWDWTGWSSIPSQLDTDGDGYNEIMVARYASTTRNYLSTGSAQTGNKLWEYSYNAKNDDYWSIVISEVATADLDNDGSSEIIFGSTDGYLHILGEDGTLIKKYNLGGIVENPTIGDIDDDGKAEIVVKHGVIGGASAQGVETQSLKDYIMKRWGISKEAFDLAGAEVDTSMSILAGSTTALSILNGPDPDLVITSSDITVNPVAPEAGDEVTITVRVRNQKSDSFTAKPFVVHFYDNGKLIDSKVITDSISASGSKDVSIKTKFGIGSHTIKVVVDPYDTVPETSDSNNEAEKLVEVVDKTPPSISIHSPEDGLTYDAYSIPLSFSVSDPSDVAFAAYSLDGDEFTTISQIEEFSDGEDEKEMSFSGPGFATEYIKVPKDAEIRSASLDLSGYTSMSSPSTWTESSFKDFNSYSGLSNIEISPTSGMVRVVQKDTYLTSPGYSSYSFVYSNSRSWKTVKTMYVDLDYSTAYWKDLKIVMNNYVWSYSRYGYGYYQLLGNGRAITSGYFFKYSSPKTIDFDASHFANEGETLKLELQFYMPSYSYYGINNKMEVYGKEFYSQGTYESNAFDSGSPDNVFDRLSWSFINNYDGSFSYKSAGSESELESKEYSQPVSMITYGVSFNERNRWFKYKANLKASADTSEIVRYVSARYYDKRPTNVEVDTGSDGTVDWTFDGELSSTNSPTTVDLNPEAINNYIASNPADADGYVEVPIKISSDSAGILGLSGLSIGYPAPSLNYYLENAFEDIEEGEHNLQVTAEDAFGNPATEEVQFFVEVPPEITIYSPEETAYNTRSVDLKYSVEDKSGVFMTLYQLDDEDTAYVLYGDTVLEDLSEGWHKVTLYSIDNRANLNTKTVDFAIDLTNPTIFGVHHTPRFPVSKDNIALNANVLDNIWVSKVQAVYSTDGWKTYEIEDMHTGYSGYAYYEKQGNEDPLMVESPPGNSKRVIVKLKKGKKLHKSDIEKHNGKKVRGIEKVNAEVIEVKDVKRFVRELLKNPNVLSVQEAVIYEVLDVPQDLNYTEQWNMTTTNGEDGWNYTMGEGETAAADTGTDYTNSEPDDEVLGVLQDLNYTEQWNMRLINVEEGWNYTMGDGVTVAVLDTGVDYNHPDLDRNILSGYDWVNQDNDPMDDNGHGTHVAGILAAERNDIGVIGVAPRSKVLAHKVLGSSGYGYDYDVASAIVDATDSGADVISLSLGGGYSSVLEDACKYAYDKGVLIVAAAGNDGGAVLYPAALDTVVAVSSINSDATLSGFSSRGPEIEMSAPGGGDKLIYSTKPYGGYGWASGTSVAAPHVSGVAALLKSMNSDWSNEDIRAYLHSSAIDLGSEGRDEFFGYGLVDAARIADGSQQPVRQDLTYSDDQIDLSLSVEDHVLSATVKVSLTAKKKMNKVHLRDIMVNADAIRNVSADRGKVRIEDANLDWRIGHVKAGETYELTFEMDSGKCLDLGAQVEGRTGKNEYISEKTEPLCLPSKTSVNTAWFMRTYTANIGKFPDKTTIQYYIAARDQAGNFISTAYDIKTILVSDGMVEITSPKNMTYGTRTIPIDYVADFPSSAPDRVTYSLDGQVEETLLGEITTFSDLEGFDIGSTTSVTFDSPGSASAYLNLPKDAKASSAKLDVTGFVHKSAIASFTDGFEDGDWTGNLPWTWNTESYSSIQSGTKKEGDYALKVSIPDSYHQKDIIAKTPTSVSGDRYHVYSTWIMLNYRSEMKWRFTLRKGTIDIAGIGMVGMGTSGDAWSYLRASGWGGANIGTGGRSNHWYKAVIEYNPVQNKANYYIYDSDGTTLAYSATNVAVASGTVDNLAITSMNSMPYGGQRDFYWDDIKGPRPPYPINPALDAGEDGTVDWSFEGVLDETNSPKHVDLGPTTINQFLATCSSDEHGYCRVPLKISSGSAGIIELNSLSIRYERDVNLTNLTTGLHNLTVVATNKEGTVAGDTVYFTVDSEPPIIEILGVENGSYYNTDVVISLNVTDPYLDYANMTLNGEPYLNGTVISEEGPYTLDVFAVDTVGNNASAALNFTIDKTPPVTNVTLNGTEGTYGWYTSNVTVTLVSNDTNAVVATNYSFDGTNWIEYLEPFNVSEEGIHTIWYFSKDIAGNNETPKTVEVKIDKTPPAVGLWLDPSKDEYLNTEPLPLKYEVNDPVVRGTPSGNITLVFDIDGVTVSDPTDITCWVGTHILTLTAFDEAGNNASASVEFSTVLTTGINIDPDTLNLYSNGNWITAYIEVPAGGCYDVMTIDVNTLLINDIVPAETNPKYEFVSNPQPADEDGDGVPEFVAKFSRDMLGEILEPADEMTLTVTGAIPEGDFEGTDTIRVIANGNNKTKDKTSLKVDKKVKAVEIDGERDKSMAEVNIDLIALGSQPVKAVLVHEYVPDGLIIKNTGCTYVGYGLMCRVGTVEHKETVRYTLALPEVSEPATYELKTVVEYQNFNDLMTLEKTSYLTVNPKGQAKLAEGKESKGVKAKGKGYIRVHWALPDSKGGSDNSKGKKKGHDKDKGKPDKPGKPENPGKADKPPKDKDQGTHDEPENSPDELDDSPDDNNPSENPGNGGGNGKKGNDGGS